MDEQFDDFVSPEKDSVEKDIPSSFPIFQEDVLPVPKKKNKTCRKAGLLALCFALIGSMIGSVITLAIYPSFMEKESDFQSEADISYILESRRNAVLEILPVDGSEILSPSQVYASNVNSTVGITTSVTTNFWGYQTTSAASGSGFIISSDGYILTNYHVVEESDKISVSLYDGTAYDAQLIGYDESNDIAVLKVEADNLIPVILGDSDQLNVGDSVVAIGNPLGELTFSLTSGTISAVDRKITLSRTVSMNLIQTDCAINSGNSGGALFNLYGEVIGITNTKYSTSSATEASIDNIGFAIPVNNILYIVESIIEKGYVSKPYIGVMVSDVSEQIQLYGIPKGAAVQSVTENGPADKTGLQPGDIVTHINENTISSSSDLVDIVSSSMPGDTLVLTIYRQGQTLELTVAVEERIQSAADNRPAEQNLQPNSGNLRPDFSFGTH